MWTKNELDKIGEMYSKLPDESLEDFLPSYLIDAVKAEEGKAYENLRKFTHLHKKFFTLTQGVYNM